jgi:hypothetical protein
VTASSLLSYRSMSYCIWMDGLHDIYDYLGYYCITLIMSLITLMGLALCMLKFIGANLISSLFKMAKILKVRFNC